MNFKFAGVGHRRGVRPPTLACYNSTTTRCVQSSANRRADLPATGSQHTKGAEVRNDWYTQNAGSLDHAGAQRRLADGAFDPGLHQEPDRAHAVANPVPAGCAQQHAEGGEDSALLRQSWSAGLLRGGTGGSRREPGGVGRPFALRCHSERTASSIALVASW